MPVTANLVLGKDGSSRLGADSRALSTPEDRAHFLAQRRTRDCIIIGRRTAANYGYENSPCPIIVLSQTTLTQTNQNPKVHWWREMPTAAIARASREFGPNIGIESGPTLLSVFLEYGLVDRLELSITSRSGGENFVDSAKLLGYFMEVTSQVVAETTFYSASQPVKK